MANVVGIGLRLRRANIEMDETGCGCADVAVVSGRVLKQTRSIFPQCAFFPLQIRIQPQNSDKFKYE